MTVSTLLAQPQALTALAQLVAIHMANGVTATKEIARLTGYSDRAILKAKKELGCGTRVRKETNPGAEGNEPGCGMNRTGVRNEQHPGAEPHRSAAPGCGNAPECGTRVRSSRARIETPSGLLTHLENKNPLGSPNIADELARQAYLDGERIKGGLVAKSARAVTRAKGELDGSQGIKFESGKLTVMNGAAAELLQDFPGIDVAAVCDRAGPGITRLNYPTRDDAMAELRKWARIAVEDRKRNKPKKRELTRY